LIGAGAAGSVTVTTFLRIPARRERIPVGAIAYGLCGAMGAASRHVGARVRLDFASGRLALALGRHDARMDAEAWDRHADAAIRRRLGLPG